MSGAGVPVPGNGRLEGVVTKFDDHVGLGAVATARGASYRFHCTQIAGGGRTVPVGQRVTFVVIPGRGGVWEAADLRLGKGGDQKEGAVAGHDEGSGGS